ncbi:MAG TPA: DUF6531 domain-containing protein, partial [Acidimicrobiales bacterium]|nr:DUF6531 domain-containing protein [Acidimicrobiales bacterium]
MGVAFDSSGRVYVGDSNANLIRRVDPASGSETVVAGNGGTGYFGDGGAATSANMTTPQSQAIDSHGNLVIADTSDHAIRVVAGSTASFYGVSMTTGDIYTVAGTGTLGYSGDGGAARSAELRYPYSVAVDANGNIVIADTYNDRVRIVAGSTGSFYGISMTLGDIYTVAGNGTAGYSGDGGAATSAELGQPKGVTLDANGNLVVADTFNYRIRVVAETTATYYGQSMTAGDIYTVAGTGSSGYSGDGGAATSAKLYLPEDVATDSHGNLVVADRGNNVIRVVAEATGSYYGVSMTTGDIYTVAGNGTAGYSGDGGAAISAKLSSPQTARVDGSGNLVIADTANNRVRVVAGSTGTFYGISMTAGDIYTMAGNGTVSYSGDSGTATSAQMWFPMGVAVDAHGNVLIADGDNNVIRAAAHSTGTFYGVAMTAGDIYTVAGNGAYGYSGDGGTATSAEMDFPQGIAIDGQGNLVIADDNNNVIRVVAESTATFYGVAMTAGDIYTVAGTGTFGYSGDGGSATSAKLHNAQYVAVDGHGNLVMSDTDNNVIRVVAESTATFYGVAMTAGDIYTVAGTGTSGSSGDGGAATSAKLDFPEGVALDAKGNLVIADFYNSRIRVVAESTASFYGVAMTAGDIYTVAGSSQGYSGDGGAATSGKLSLPYAVTVDGQGNLVIADTFNDAIRVVAESTASFYGVAMTAGDIYTVAGNGNYGYTGDGGAATSAELYSPEGVALDGEGNLLVGDSYNDAVRSISGGPSAPSVGSNSYGGANLVSKQVKVCNQGDPIDCATGDFWETYNLLSVPGRGIPLSFSMSYNSLAAAQSSAVGSGWTFNYGASLATDALGNATVTEDNGSTVPFVAQSGGGFLAPSWAPATLVHNGDGTYTFTRLQDDVQFAFSSTGQLSSITDRNGYVTSLSYTSGKLSTVTDPAGRQLIFTYTGSLITGVSDPSRSITLGYTSGNLTSITDAATKVTSFTYDTGGQHLLLTVTRPNGQTGGPNAGTHVTNTYDSSGRILTQQDPAGLTTTYAYAGVNSSVGGGTTTITDPHGNVTVEHFANNLLTSSTKASGTSIAATTTYTYDPVVAGQTTVTDPNGHTTTNTYDANGNVLTSKDALSKTTTDTYNSLNEPLTVTDPMGIVTTYTYDADGNALTKVVKGVGGSPTETTTYTYGDGHNGDLTQVQDPDGHITTYTYDTYGDVASTTTSAGSTGTSATNAVDKYAYTSIRAVGSFVHNSANGLTTLSVSPQAVGDAEVLSVEVSSGSITVSSVSGGGATWSKLTNSVDSSQARDVELWLGTVTTTGS